ncbi:MAG: DUF620 domain-containing protein [Bryobacteraceae bacterium]
MRLTSLAILTVCLGALPAADEKLPTADAIIDRYINVTGGAAAYDGRKNETSKVTMEIIGQNMKAAMVKYNALPNKSYSVVDLPGAGKIEQGSNGDVVWERSPMQGPRVKSGDERLQYLRGTNLRAQAHWRDHYKNPELAGVDMVNGEGCYKVKLTALDGKPETRWYSRKSGLLLKSEMVVKNPMGDIQAVVTASDYRKTPGGILIPHTIRQMVLGREMVFTVLEVKANEDLPKDRFDVPADVKALLK